MQDNKINILVFPCGSEVGLEIYRSLEYSRHIKLFGGSSIDDHGKFVFKNYINNIPFIDDNSFLLEFKKIVKDYHIDAIYPTMDSVISKLKSYEKELGCTVIASPVETTNICLSKKKTYDFLKKVINTPKLFNNIESVKQYPVFMKPVIGYGSRGAKKINSFEEGLKHLIEYPNCIISEYLSGEEFTVDCFTDKNGELVFVGPRPRRRTRNGISVNTISIKKKNRREFEELALKINNKLKFKGAWFFQVKRNNQGELFLLEIASRLAGSSSVYRLKGINFALLSIFDALDKDIEIIENDYQVEVDRALDIKADFKYKFDKVYVDFDDCLIIEGKVNTSLVSKLYSFINEGKKIYLITKHDNDIKISLQKYRLSTLFDEVIHLNETEKKSKYITGNDAIFIDDSYSERKEVALIHNIPVYSPDMIN